jgi:hypothetical protein
VKISSRVASRPREPMNMTEGGASSQGAGAVSVISVANTAEDLIALTQSQEMVRALARSGPGTLRLLIIVEA